jgi:hypothetical protein
MHNDEPYDPSHDNLDNNEDFDVCDWRHPNAMEAEDGSHSRPEVKTEEAGEPASAMKTEPQLESAGPQSGVQPAVAPTPLHAKLQVRQPLIGPGAIPQQSEARTAVGLYLRCSSQSLIPR